jgi:hypothetical protein
MFRIEVTDPGWAAIQQLELKIERLCDGVSIIVSLRRSALGI